MNPRDHSGLDAAPSAESSGSLDRASSSTPQPPFRGFAAIHRDVWRIVCQAPVIFVLLPALLWFPIDYLIEAGSALLGGSESSQLKHYLRLAQLAQIVMGTLVTSVLLAALVDIGKGKSITAGAALKQGLSLWPDMIITYLAMFWRVTLGFLLLILPGIYLMVRYAMMSPVVAFEDLIGKKALDRSITYMKGNHWRVFTGVCGAGLLYLPLAITPTILTVEDAPPLILALNFIPVRILLAFVVIALTLIYADLRPELALASPIGRTDEPVVPRFPQEPESSGRRGVALAILASVSVLIGIGLHDAYMEQIVDRAEVAWSQEDYEESLELYEKAARWNDEDPYLRYSIAWSLYMLDRTQEAESSFSKAVQMNPEEPHYRVDHARTLGDLGRLAEAREELRIARDQGFQDQELLDTLDARFAETRGTTDAAQDAVEHEGPQAGT